MLYLSKTVAKITFLLLLTLMLVCPAGYRPAADASAAQTGIISAWKLNVRSAPSRDAGVVMVLSQNDRVDVIEKRGGIGGWLKISVNGQTGYIRNRPRYVTLIDTIRPRKLKPKPVEEQTARPASGETQTPRQEKKRIEQKIKAEEEKIATFSRKEEIIIEGLNEIDATLNRARLKVDSISKRIRELEGAIADIREKRKAVAASFRENQDYCATRLNALFRMKMLGKIGITAEPDSLFDFIVNQTAMERILSTDLQLMNDQIESLKQFAELEKQLKKKKSEKMTLEKELKQEILTKERESEKKSAILTDIRKEKKLARAAVASLREAEKQLGRQIKSMEQKGGGRHLSTASIIPYKGQLEMPVSGKIISRFGTNRTGDYKSFTFQSGIDISVERGEPVRAVFHGEVLFARWFKGYGNLMIINHGGSYYTLYAHVEEFFKNKGDPVEKGEVIATAGDTGSIKGLCLHFEIRHHGKPVNPMDWLKKGA